MKCAWRVPLARKPQRMHVVLMKMDIFQCLGGSFGTIVRAEQKFVGRIVLEACFILAYIILPLLCVQHCSPSPTPKLYVLDITGRD